MISFRRQAKLIKKRVARRKMGEPETGPDSEPVIPTRDWFKSGYTKRTINRKSVGVYGDHDHASFLDPGCEEIAVPQSVHDQFERWVLGLSEDELMRLLKDPDLPSGPVGKELTPCQRLFLYTVAHSPYSMTAEVKVSGESIRSIAAESRWCERSTRKLPIESKFSRRAGTMGDVTIWDLPPGAGKTMLAVMLGAMMTSPALFTSLVESHTAKKSGTVYAGSADVKVARLVVIGTMSTTYSHFVLTTKELLPHFNSLWPRRRFVIWEGTGKDKTPERAYCMPTDATVIWILPLSSVTEAISVTPDVDVALLVMDEYIVDTPRKKYQRNESSAAKFVILQATPEALCTASGGYQNELQKVFNGSIVDPRHIRDAIVRRDFKTAQRGCDGLAKLMLFTTSAFRGIVRDDLARLVPNGLAIYQVRCRRVSLASALLDSKVDLVAADLASVLLTLLKPLSLTDESIQTVRNLAIADAITPADAVQVFQKLQSANELIDVGASAVIRRLTTRIEEVTNACPICYDEVNGDFKMMGCCGYVLCARCAAPLQKCAFCRTDLRTTRIARSDAEPEADHHALSYPKAPEWQPTDDVDSSIRTHTSSRHTQLYNLVMVLHTLRHDGKRRVLMLVQNDESNHFGFASERHGGVNYGRLCAVTGYQLGYVPKPRGRGADYAVEKARFDDPAQPPIALVCDGYDDRVAVGADFASADALVVVGSVYQERVVQLIGRVFRPNRKRDNTKPMTIVWVFT